MAEVENATEKSNGISLELIGEDDDSFESKRCQHQQDLTLFAVLHRLITQIFFPDPSTGVDSTNLLHRIKTSFSENFPLLREASENVGRDVLLWTRRGSPLRALLVVSVGMVTLLALTGFLVFMLFFIVATVNAIVISFLVCLAAVGGFLALFFTCVTAIYIAALSIAAFVIAAASISAIVVALFVSGWIGFFFTIWLLMKKSVDVAKLSVSITGSALSGYSSTRHTQVHHETAKDSD